MNTNDEFENLKQRTKSVSSELDALKQNLMYDAAKTAVDRLKNIESDYSI